MAQPPGPEPCNAGRDAIESFAAEIASRAGLTPGAPLKPFVERLGGRLRYMDLSDTALVRSGAMQVHGPNKFEIYLSLDTPRVRNRFTIAHELGHYFLHYPMVREKHNTDEMFVARYGGNEAAEPEANCFAAGLLMPRDEFEKAARDFKADKARIADHFDVSQEAVAIRMQILGL